LRDQLCYKLFDYVATLVRNGEIIYSASGGGLVISRFAPFSFISAIAVTEAELQSACRHVIDACKHTNDPSLIISYELYSIPGFVKTLRKAFPPNYSISSSLDSCLAQAGDGCLSLIIIEKTASWVIEGNHDASGFSSNEIRQLFVEPLRQNFFNSMRAFLLPGVTEEQVFAALFDYNNILTLNELVTDPSNRIFGNQNAFDRQNLHFGKSGFKGIFNKELPLTQFFTTLAEGVCQFVADALLRETVSIQSPLLAYVPMLSFMEHCNASLSIVNELAAEPIIQGHKIRSGEIVIEGYPENSTACLPFTTWLLTNQSGAYHFLYRGKRLCVDFNIVNGLAANAYFSISNQRLYKFLAIFNEDYLTDPWLQIKDLNDHIYYSRVTNVQI